MSLESHKKLESYIINKDYIILLNKKQSVKGSNIIWYKNLNYGCNKYYLITKQEREI